MSTFREVNFPFDSLVRGSLLVQIGEGISDILEGFWVTPVVLIGLIIGLITLYHK